MKELTWRSHRDAHCSDSRWCSEVQWVAWRVWTHSNHKSRIWIPDDGSHASRIVVRVGQRVKHGQVIAYVGSSGVSTGSHLHYEVHVSGKPVNPWSYMN